MDEYKEIFMFVNGKNNAQCLICDKIFTNLRFYNLKRHFISIHKNINELDEEKKYEMFNSLQQKNAPPLSLTVEEKKKQLKNASIAAGLMLAKQCRPFEDGEFFKQMAREIFNCFGEKGKSAYELIENIHLSRYTIARRTEKISKYIFKFTLQRLKDCEYFSICLDESTDITNISQLIVCIRSVDKNMECFEEFFSCFAFHGHVNGETIFDCIKNNILLTENGDKLASICTDGAKVMLGKEKGLKGQLMKNNIHIPNFHCIIHQSALFAKKLNIVETMDTACRIINKIKGGHNALTHRKFKSLLEELQSCYGDLLLYTEVRWLSRGKSLERLFNLRDEVQLFLEQSEKNELKEMASSLKDKNFVSDLAFLCDLTEIINEYNLTLQGRNKTIFHLTECSHRFERKIKIILSQLRNNDTSNLPRTFEILAEYRNDEKIAQYTEIVASLVQNFADRFEDFKSLKTMIDIHNDPLTEKNVDNLELAAELEIMKNDINLPLDTGKSFWKKINKEKYPVIKKEILKLYSMFGSTYDCEAAFSILKLIKSKYRNKLTDEHLCDLLRIKLYEGEIIIGDVDI